MSTKINSVLYNIDQRSDTTSTEKLTARQNIGAQGQLTAGSNIQLDGDTISATDTTYTAGNGLNLSGTEFSVDTSVVQEKLTAGSNVQINGSTISATDTTYTAGTGLNLNGTQFSVDTTTIQPKLTAGNNVQIDQSTNTISATDTTYTAGTNVQINGTTISATDTTYSAGNGLALNGTTFSVDTSAIQPKLTAGSNIQINGNTISATDTTYTAGTNVQINGTTISATDTKYTAGTNVQISSGNVISATDTKYTAGSGLALNGTEFSNTAPNVQCDWNATSGAAVLLHKPTIPTVGNGTLTITRNNVSAGTFTANQSGNSTIDISVPDPEVFVALWDGVSGTKTSFADVSAAYTAGKKVLLKWKNSATQYDFAELTEFKDSTYALFTQLRGMLNGNTPGNAYTAYGIKLASDNTYTFNSDKLSIGAGDNISIDSSTYNYKVISAPSVVKYDLPMYIKTYSTTENAYSSYWSICGGQLRIRCQYLTAGSSSTDSLVSICISNLTGRQFHCFATFDTVDTSQLVSYNGYAYSSNGSEKSTNSDFMWPMDFDNSVYPEKFVLDVWYQYKAGTPSQVTANFWRHGRVTIARIHNNYIYGFCEYDSEV